MKAIEKNYRKMNVEQLNDIKGGRSGHYIYIIGPDGTRYRVWL